MQTRQSAVSAALPSEPMAPIAAGQLPQGEDWAYQLKWDGVRLLAQIGNGAVKLYSRSMLLKNDIYPEIAGLLSVSAGALGDCLLDGELVWWDGVRPSFQRVLKRERSRGADIGRSGTGQYSEGGSGIAVPIEAAGTAGNRRAGDAMKKAAGSSDASGQAASRDSSQAGAASPLSASGGAASSYAEPGCAADSLIAGPGRAAGSQTLSPGLVYVLFDLLADESGDLRAMPYVERYRRLRAKLAGAGPLPRIFAADMYRDPERLWAWVETNRFEGVVAKRLSSVYKEGKKHKDWYKKKTSLLLDVDIVGLKWRSGIVASLVMSLDGEYAGSVSLGLNDALRAALASTFRPDPSLPPLSANCPFRAMPADLKKEQVQWLGVPFRCRVTGLELTQAGQLRHPKLVTFLPKEPPA